MTRVKICGITRAEDALRAAKFGATALGFIFTKDSPRFVGAYKAKKIIDQLPPFVTTIGVFVNQKEGAVKDIAQFCQLGALQFHGDETPKYCQRFKGHRVIKSFRVSQKINLDDIKKYQTSAYLFDTFSNEAYGGTGETFDWKWIKGVKNLGVPMILSGGLNSTNIRSAIESVSPYGVDISSSVEESPGRKSERKLKDFFLALP